MSKTCIVKPHDCKQNDYQDRKYGMGYRVANYGNKKDVWTCTVCGKQLSPNYKARA